MLKSSRSLGVEMSTKPDGSDSGWPPDMKTWVPWDVESSEGVVEEQPARRVGRACLRCQRHRIKCDTERPCSQCTKRGCADTCGDEVCNAIAQRGKRRCCRVRAPGGAAPSPSLPSYFKWRAGATVFVHGLQGRARPLRQGATMLAVHSAAERGLMCRLSRRLVGPCQTGRRARLQVTSLAAGPAVRVRHGPPCFGTVPLSRCVLLSVHCVSLVGADCLSAMCKQATTRALIRALDAALRRCMGPDAASKRDAGRPGGREGLMHQVYQSRS